MSVPHTKGPMHTRYSPLQFNPLHFSICFQFFSKQFKSLHFQRFSIACSTTLYFCCPSRLLQAAIFSCRCSCAVRQSLSTQVSGGMKVKVVLAAAMWQNPHVLMLDEPTNYLDCDGLGVLVLAIQGLRGLRGRGANDLRSTSDVCSTSH